MRATCEPNERIGDLVRRARGRSVRGKTSKRARRDADWFAPVAHGPLKKLLSHLSSPVYSGKIAPDSARVRALQRSHEGEVSRVATDQWMNNGSNAVSSAPKQASGTKKNTAALPERIAFSS
jgi:hypothetical protein